MDPQGWNKTTLCEKARDFGGAKFGGIEPAYDSGNLSVCTDPDSGKDFGYDFDGWTSNNEVFPNIGNGQIVIKS